MTRRNPRSGLVLLIVLGMLALLSLISVTYLVFSAESRRASLQLARGDYRGTPPDKLIDQVVHQVIRGTKDSQSPLWLNDLLGDIYGTSVPGAPAPQYSTGADEPFQVHEARPTLTPTTSWVARDNPFRHVAQNYVMPPALATYDGASPESPRLFGDHLLKIPIAWPVATNPTDVKLPEQHDAWTGRVLTFIEGPLEGQSFRILRYMGEVGLDTSVSPPVLDPMNAANQYSLVIDLSEVRDRVTSGFYGGQLKTLSVGAWISGTSYRNCLDLLFKNVTGTAPRWEFDDPYDFFINAGVTNSYGLGLDFAGNPAKTPLPATSQYHNAINESMLGNYSRARVYQGSSYTPKGDTDEPYDAADAENFFLALRQALPATPPSNSDDSDRITPSYHRPAVINYLSKTGIIPNFSAFNPNAYVPAEIQQLKDWIELIRRATARPLSVRISYLNGNTGNPLNDDYVLNPSFTGSNQMETRFGFLRTPQLTINWLQIHQPPTILKIHDWLRWLTRGPWDVDNDGDLINDSNWMDVNLPLVTSPEGKLLKILAAFYIEDLDGKLDMNAAGSREQADDVNFNQGRVNGGLNNKYAYLRNYTGPGAGNTHWPQGGGYGTADISLRPIFDLGTAVAPSQAYGDFLNFRYSSADRTDLFPGSPNVDDPLSMLNERAFVLGPITTYKGHNPTASPLNGLAANCFPLSTRGRSGIALDLLGNPIHFENDNTFNELVDDPYDQYVLRDRNSDHGIAVSDWERLARFNDIDRSGLPSGLQKISSGTLTPGSPGYLDRIRSISPRNVNLSLPRFSGEYTVDRYVAGPSGPVPQQVTRRVSSFIEFVEYWAQKKYSSSAATPHAKLPATPLFTAAQLQDLFPVEFRQNRPMDINRPLGNGLDDDGNGVIDEAEEIRLGQFARYPMNTASTVYEDYMRGSGYDPELATESAALQLQFDGNQGKQALARHLYCLAQLILPETYVFANDTNPSTITTADQVSRRARTLAQWAVNVVDFRDADSAMTRFAYDEDPFARYNAVDPSNPPNPKVRWIPDDGVVFGVEAPELLITESLAIHDMRIRNKAGAPPSREQLRIPQGSLFLEFLCPRTTMPAAPRGAVDGTIPPATGGLYAFDAAGPAGTLKLNLGAMTPPALLNPSNPVSYPVWRVVFTKPVASGAVASAGNFKDRLSEIYETPADRFNYTYQFDGSTTPTTSKIAKVPWYLNTAAGTIPEPEIDRILWFSGVQPSKQANNDNTGWEDPNAAEKIFYGYAGSNYLAGGQYLVVGPRDITYFGSRDQGPGPRDHQPSRQRIQITNSTTSDWVQYWNINNDPLFWKTPTAPLVANNTATTAVNWGVSSLVRDTVTLIAGMEKPSSWTDTTHTNYMIGLNISEPTRNSYYPEPLEFTKATNNTRDTETNAPGFASLPKDGYIDTNTNSGTSRPPLDRDGSSHAYLQNAGWPAGAETDRPAIRTAEDWSAAVLQRLADPLRGWDPKYNPYITVDWLPIDLTVFSGEEQFPADGAIKLGTRRKTGGLITPDTTPPAAPTPPTFTGATFYSYHSAPTHTASVQTGNPMAHYFDYELQTEYICKAPAPAVPTRDSTAEFATLGYLNPQFTIRGTLGSPPPTDDYVFQGDTRYLGSPGPNTAAGLNVPLAPYFPNRDFVNVMELTSVPISSPSSFMQDFGIQGTPSDALPMFTHTLDFEDLRTPAPPATPQWAQKLTSGILLELLSTKNPWPDTNKVENPVNVAATSATPDEVAKHSMFEPFRAPLNAFPTYREPGKINLNTLTESTVFRGLMWNAMTPSLGASANWYTTLNEKLNSTSMPYWTEFQNLRRGFVVSPTGTNNPFLDANPYLDPAHSSEFAHPFTSAATYDQGPLTTTQYDRASHSGLLRRGEASTAPFNMATSTTAKPRLFRADVDNVFPDGATTGNVPFNTYIRNYPASRLANLTTDRSSVFVIRVTLGYFETDASGALLGEYGAELGNTKRPRAVYVIDRSIPVGYQPGVDSNTDNVILLRRMIE